MGYVPKKLLPIFLVDLALVGTKTIKYKKIGDNYFVI